MTPEEVSTLASIVEEETNNNEEKANGSRIVYQPVTSRYALTSRSHHQICPAGFWPAPNYQRAFKKSILPYNTYINTGLPPGPIRIPSKKGIDSVLNYTKHNYIYMCAKEDFSGTHNFASNYADHMANAKKILESPE